MKTKLISTLLSVIFISFNAFSATIVSVKPLSENYIQITFDDGDIVYFDNLGQDNNDDTANLNPLDINAAENTANYSISSSNDSNFSTAQNPIEIGRFTKGHEYSGKEVSFPISYRHQIFLKLNNNMISGRNYSISLSGNINNGTVYNFTFDPFQQQSEAVHVNQIGYRADAGLKIAYVGKYIGSLGGLELNNYGNTNFYLVDISSNNTVFTGTLSYRYDYQTDPAQNAYGYNFYGADVWECDFSGFNTPGNYKIVVDKFGSSFPFSIGNDVYADIFYDVARSMYHQRCGTALDAAHTEYSRPLCHHPDLASYTPTYSNVKQMYGANAFSELIANDTGIPMPNAFRRYHDAADWDSYPDHLNVAFYLNLLFELKPNNFNDGQLNIPESGNGIPDILDESKWGIDAFRRLIGPTGGICGGVEETTEPGFGDASYQDQLQWFTYAEEPRATYMTAAALAQYAYIMNSIGITDSVANYISEAANLYVWANNNKIAGDDPIVYEEEILAAAMLYRATGNNSYQQDYKVLFDNLENMITYPENATTCHMALFTYARTNYGNTDQNYVNSSTNKLLNYTSFTSTTPCTNKAFRYANNPYRPIVVGASTTPFTYQLIFAYELTGDPTYLNFAHSTNDYFLGGNMMNMCWVTGHGQKHPKEMTHLDSWVDGIPEMIPGFSIYGNLYPPQSYGWVTENGHGYTGVYPSDIPSELAYFENRYCPITAEFTIHETLAPYAFSLGYFTSPSANVDINDAEIKLEDCGISVYYDPHPNFVKIKGLSGSYTIQILNGNSQVYQTLSVSGTDQIIDISALPSGIFFLYIKNNNDNNQSSICKLLKL